MSKKIYKIILIACILILSLIIQGSFLKLIPFITTGPNLLIIVVTGIGFMVDRKMGLIVGLFAGLLLDLQYGVNFGLYGLVFMQIGYFSGVMSSIFVKDYLLILMSIIAVSDFVFNLIIYIFSFLFRQRFQFLNYLFYNIIPEIIMTLIMTLILYKPLIGLTQKLSFRDKRR